MSLTYQVFTYNGNSVILLPGKMFSRNELNLRLNKMEIDYDKSSLSKQYFIDLYENGLKLTSNILKIFDRLQKDTTIYNYKANELNRNVSQNYSEIPINNNLSKITIIGNNIINEDNLKNQQKYSLNSDIFSTTNIQQKNNSYNNESILESYNNYKNKSHNNIIGQNSNNNNNLKENNIKVSHFENNEYYKNQNNNQYTFKDDLMNEIQKNKKKNIININNIIQSISKFTILSPENLGVNKKPKNYLEKETENLKNKNILSISKQLTHSISNSNIDNVSKCIICFENISIGERHYLHCGHIFHCTCINKWFNFGKNYCPICRQNKDCLNKNLEIEMQEIGNDNNLNNNSIINGRNRYNYSYIIKYIFGCFALYLVTRYKYVFFSLAFISYFL